MTEVSSSRYPPISSKHAKMTLDVSSQEDLPSHPQVAKPSPYTSRYRSEMANITAATNLTISPV